MSLVETLHAEHKARLHRLGRFAKPVAPAPVVVAPVAVKPMPAIDKSYYPQMWFWQLVNFVPRVSKTAVTLHQVGPRIGSIQAAVANRYGVTKTDIISRRRCDPAVEARHVAMYIATTLTTQSTLQIGRMFTRDHTVILYARKKIARRVACDPIFAARIEDIKAELLS